MIHSHPLGRVLATVSLALSLALAGCATPAPSLVSPEAAGFSADGLTKLKGSLQAKVDAGKIPGAVVLIVRDGQVAMFDAVGYRDREAKAPMSTDAIFRMASMTKPVTSLAVMMLAEAGQLKITDPVSRYLPEFRNLGVGVERKNAAGALELVTEPARLKMTIEDLLRHTSGLTYGVFGKSMVKDLYNAANLFDTGQSKPS